MRTTRLVVAAGAGLSLVLGGMALAGTADGQGAQKSALTPTSGSMTNQCQSSAAGPSNGFAILNAPGKVGAIQKINGEVSLKRGPANTTFIVNLANGGNCMPVAMLTTNGQGNGNAHVNQPGGMAGTYYVVLQDTMGQEVYASSPVPLR